MENNKLEKSIDLAGDIVKLAANITDPKKKAPRHPRATIDEGDKIHSPQTTTGSQNIHIDVGGKKDADIKPVEKHIHEFPDNRPMTEKECDLALEKAKMDYELKKADQEFNQKAYNREYEHRLEVEKKNEKRRKIRNIIAGLLAAGGVGYFGYSLWTDHRNHKTGTAAPEKIPEVKVDNTNAE